MAKIIFINAPRAEFSDIRDLLTRLPNNEYYFILLPLEDRLLTKTELLNMLKKIR